MTKTLPTLELVFGGVRWMMQVAEEMVVFTEQSGFYGRTKKVTFSQHPEMKHELGVTVQLQSETATAPLAKHIATMHLVARFALGLDRWCPKCWSVLARPNEPETCDWCAELKAEGRAIGGSQLDKPVWLWTINAHLKTLQDYRLENWGLTAKE